MYWLLETLLENSEVELRSASAGEGAGRSAGWWLQVAQPGARGAAATERCFAFHGCLGPSCSQARLWSVVTRSQLVCATYELCDKTEAMQSSHVRFVAANPLQLCYDAGITTDRSNPPPAAMCILPS